MDKRTLVRLVKYRESLIEFAIRAKAEAFIPVAHTPNTFLGHHRFEYDFGVSKIERIKREIDLLDMQIPIYEEEIRNRNRRLARKKYIG